MKTNLEEDTTLDLTADEIDRYSRQMILPEVSLEGQKRLKKARVLVIGAGGIGSSLLMYLAAAGIGTIGIVDDDKVDCNNLHRQVIHSEEERGKPKVHSAQRRIKQINPFVSVELFQTRIDRHSARQLVRLFDVVCDGSDNALTRYIVNDACVIEGKPLISGAAVKWEGQLTIYNHGDGPCYRCLFPECPKAAQVMSCADNGVIGMIPGTIGQLQALECLKFVTQQGQTLHKRMLIFDGLNMTFKVAKLRGRVASCVACGPHKSLADMEAFDYEDFVGISCQVLPGGSQPVPELSWEEFISRGPEGKKLVDVRPKSNHSILHFTRPAGVVHLPLEEMRGMGQAQLREACGLESTAAEVFIFCKAGVRSRLAASLMRGLGFENVSSIRGGMLAYREQVDPSLPTLK